MMTRGNGPQQEYPVLENNSHSSLGSSKLKSKFEYT